MVETSVRMAAGVYLPQGVDVDVGVDLRGFHPGMAEHFLHVADVRPTPMHVGGAGVAEEVTGARLVDPTTDHEFLDPVAEVVGRKAGAVAAEEEGGFLGQMLEKRAGLRQVEIQPGACSLADGQHSALSALALADQERPGGGVVVVEVKPGHFAASNARGVEEFEHDAVAQAEGVIRIRGRKQGLDFLGAQSLGERAGLLAWQVEISRWVGRDRAGSTEPGEESSHAAKPGQLGVGDQRLAPARAAVVVEKELISF